MTVDPVAERLRRFMLALAVLVFLFTPAELLLVGHTGVLVQWIPFLLCGLGLIAIAVAWRWPQRSTVLVLQAVMLGIVLGSLYGGYEHLAKNIAFALEIRPNATVGDVFWGAFAGGNPLLAPGILAFGALLGWGATIGHPGLKRKT